MMKPILVFDSGFGGLSVAKAIKLALPNTPLLYLADVERFPYGGKTQNYITKRVASLLKSLQDDFDPSVVVIACNTATTAGIDEFRQTIPCPIVGVVPAIKPACLYSKTKTVGFWATKYTTCSHYSNWLIQTYANGCTVIPFSAEPLVFLGENVLYGKAPDRDIILRIFEDFFSDKATFDVDTIVLGCTHFPLLNNELMDAIRRLEKKITLIDSGDAIARRVSDLVADRSRIGQVENHLYITSKTAIKSLCLENIQQIFSFSTINHYKSPAFSS